jgi:hypothetical protein
VSRRRGFTRCPHKECAHWRRPWRKRTKATCKDCGWSKSGQTSGAQYGAGPLGPTQGSVERGLGPLRKRVRCAAHSVEVHTPQKEKGPVAGGRGETAGLRTPGEEECHRGVAASIAPQQETRCPVEKATLGPRASCGGVVPILGSGAHGHNWN